jgi:hypothetical protein
VERVRRVPGKCKFLLRKRQSFPQGLALADVQPVVKGVAITEGVCCPEQSMAFDHLLFPEARDALQFTPGEFMSEQP